MLHVISKIHSWICVFKIKEFTKFNGGVFSHFCICDDLKFSDFKEFKELPHLTWMTFIPRTNTAAI